jgi:hypothetical protein
MMDTRSRRVGAAAGIALAGALALGACGSSKKAATAPTTTAAAATTAATTASTTAATTATTTAATTATTTAATTATTTAGGGDAACTAYGDISVAMGAIQDAPPPDFYDTTLKPLVDTLRANEPAAIKSDLETMLDAVQTATTTGSFDPLGSPEFAAAQAKADPWMYDNCTFATKAEVMAMDYKYQGLPPAMKAGRVGLLLSDHGTEVHEMILLRKKDSTSESFDELLQLPQDEAQSKVDTLGAAFLPQPGAESLLIADLTPGDYMAICFVPVGTTSMSTEGQGPPHFTQGMRQEFTVSS